MKRALFVNYYFPPLGGIGSIRASKLGSHLGYFGWDVTTLAPRNGSYHRDSSLTYDPDRVVRSWSIELSRSGRRATRSGSSDLQPARVFGWRRVLRDVAREWVYRPDAQIGWYPLAISAGRRALRESRFDVILSSSFPITAHLIARRLHRDFGIPWVSEWRDPWSDVEGLSPRVQSRRSRLERALVQESSGVVLVSPSWEVLFRAKGAHRSTVVTNGFDPGEVCRALPPAHPVISHLGTFYPEMQDLRAIWEALARMAATGIKPQIRFIGSPTSAVVDELHAFGLSDQVLFTGFLPHREALAELAQSTALIVAGPRSPASVQRGWMPAKTYECLATGLPVLYVSQLPNDMATIVAQQPGGHVIRTGDCEAARSALLAAFETQVVTRDLAAFEHSTLAGRMATFLDEIVATRPGTE